MSDIKNKLEQAQSLIAECLVEISSIKKKTSPITIKESQSQKGVNIITIVNKIKNCEESENIEKNILDKSSMTGRILLPFYICQKYFPQEQLTTGGVEKITGELGVKVKNSNVAKAIKNELHKYLDSSATRVKGAKTYYKINRKGLKCIESIINT